MGKTRSESVASAVKSFRKHGLAAIPTRYVVVILSAFTNALSYTMRTNLNLTIVAMVKKVNNSTNYETCLQVNQTYNQESDTSGGEYEWSESIQGVVLGAYYYGYIITNINAGQLADWIGARWLIGFSLLSSGVFTLIIPVCAQWSVYAVIVVRILTGLVQGVLTPSLYTMLAFWVPQQERGTALALIQVGGNIGAVLTMPLSAYLIQNGFANGWPSVFYVLGVLGCLCFIPWIYEIYNSPEEHPRIKGKELIYIQSNVCVSVSSSRKKKKIWVPWRSICTSRQVWIVVITKFCSSWGNLFLMSKLPAHLESILHLSIDNNGLVNAMVYIAYSASLMLFGYASDFIEKKRLLNRTVSRKVFEVTALSGAAIFMALIPVVGCDQISVIALLISAMIILGMISGGDSPIVVDIAPDYSGSLYGFTNAFGSIPGFLAPLSVGLVLDGSQSDPMAQWNILFWVASAIYIFGALVFAIFISAKPEAWGRARTGTFRATIDQNNMNSDNYFGGSVCIRSRHGTIRENTSHDCEEN